MAGSHDLDALDQSLVKLNQDLQETLTIDDSWAAYLLRTPRFFSEKDERLGGYGGYWTFYKGTSAQPDQLEKEFKAYRCFCYTDKSTMVARFFHEKPPQGTKGTQRSQDSLYESLCERPLSHPFFLTSTAMEPVEAAQHKHACFFWRIIPWTEDFLIRMCLEMPPDMSELMATSSSANPLPGAVDPLALINSTWALEAFLDDGQTRWSAGPIYNMHTRRLISNFSIREHVTVVRPAQAIDFRDLPSPPLRPRLNHDPATWLADSFEQGVMQEAVFDEDGNMIRVKARPTTWHPPDVQDPEYTLVTYPDAVYGYFPTRLPHLRSSDDYHGKSVRFEVGGLMREVKEFRRLILRYSADGKAEGLTMEWYSPKRAKSRRSLDVLRAATPPIF